MIQEEEPKVQSEQDWDKERACHWCGQHFVNVDCGQVFVFENRAHWIRRGGGRKAASVPESAELEPSESPEIEGI